MKQVLVKGGKVSIEEVPPPAIAPGMALVRVSHSLISSGTESGFVSEGGTAGYVLKKARDPLNVEKVKRKLATVGVKGTIDVIRNKLFEFQAPGYSSAGVIVECGEEVPGFRVGDRVACAGVGYASHSEYNAVPHQLLTPIPGNVGFDEAAFVALGAIAMQGVRRVTPTFGETALVVGLGLVGQLAAQLVRIAGCRVIGCDPVASKRELAASLGAHATCAPAELPGMVHEWTAGYGADAAIICAASKGSEVTNQALDLCRQKGRISVVGAVGMQLQREAMYLKELDFFLSCSYGPGRYNANYEEKGLDYPIGYVRWTEGRNMAEFLRLLDEKQVRLEPLISVVRPVDQAQEAYDAVLGAGSETISALISYGEETEAPAEAPKRSLALRTTSKGSGIGVAVIGAGGMARGFHLPSLAKLPGCRVEAIADANPSTAKQYAERFGARYCTTDYREVLADDAVEAVVITTRHNLHTEMALAAAEAGKHIFVEKPLALTVPDAEAICEAVERNGVLLTIGFNRRFAPHAQLAKTAFDKLAAPKMVLYRCNAGPLPMGHWAIDPVEGGGRIRGEAVHLYDFCSWMIGTDPVSIRADRVDSSTSDVIAEDNVTALLRYADGSLATIVYCSTGHTAIPKERIELFGGSGAIVIDDYQGITFAGVPGKSARSKLQDKGQFALMENFIQAIQGKAELGITAEDGLRATRIAVEVLRQARSGQADEPAP